MTMDRDSAMRLINQHVSNDNLKKHMVAVGAIMRGLASRLGEDQNLWGTVGLVHDIDFEETSMKEHGNKSSQLLGGVLPKEATDAIAAHNFENTGVKPDSKMAKALIASDAVSGLIVAAALVMPSKSLSQVTADTLSKKLKDKDFARGADRGKIRYCEQLGISTTDFLSISLESLHTVSRDIGLGDSMA